MKNDTKCLGKIDVDAGCCWIGDPCYVLHQDSPPKAIGKDWGEFCELIDNEKGYTAIGDGLGICVSTAYGDGTYPVFAKFRNRRIVKVWVDFDPKDDGSEQD